MPHRARHRNTQGLLAASALVLACLAGAGCAGSRYYYRAVEPTAITPRGVPGVTYEIAGPRGTMRVASLGMRKFPAVAERPVFVVRYYLENKSPSDWRIEPALQQVVFDGQGAPTAPLASSASPTQKAFVAKAGVTQVMDLIYLPPGEMPRSFAIGWRVDAENKPRSGKAGFERAEIPASDTEGGYVGQNIQVTVDVGGGGIQRSVQ